MTVLRGLASLKLTLAGMVFLGVGVLTSYKDAEAHAWWVVAPLVVLAVNLLGALVANPRFRRQGGLLVFHLCLLAVILLAAIGQLTRLEARVEITQGQVFDSNRIDVQRVGSWHPWRRLREVAFEQGDLEVEYAPGLLRGATASHVLVTNSTGRRVSVTVGDNVPFRVSDYRFYTTSNKGYALVLTWLGDDGEARTGTVHLPSYPLFDWKQLNHWRTPGGTTVEFNLELAHSVEEDRAWTLDSRNIEGSVRVKTDGKTMLLRPGESERLPGGRLRLEALRMWMGYEIFYHPTLAWLFAAAFAGVLALAWHFWGKLWSQPLSVERQELEAGGAAVRT